jgi:hypothetical protein
MAGRGRMGRETGRKSESQIFSGFFLNRISQLQRLSGDGVFFGC